MAAKLASPRASDRLRFGGRLRPDVDDFVTGNSRPGGGNRVPTSSYRITPYGHETTYPYGHYERPVNYEGPLDDVKQKFRDLKDHKLAVKHDDDGYSSASDDDASDGELDESPRRHKVKKLGVL